MCEKLKPCIKGSSRGLGAGRCAVEDRVDCPHHSLRFVESRNAKFLENDLAGGSDLFSEREQPSTLSERLIVIQNIPQVQMGVA